MPATCITSCARRPHDPDEGWRKSFPDQHKESTRPMDGCFFMWLRGKDSNQRPPGYEPDELPAALPRDMQFICFSLNIIAQSALLVKENSSFFFRPLSRTLEENCSSIPFRCTDHKGPHGSVRAFALRGEKRGYRSREKSNQFEGFASSKTTVTVMLLSAR